MSSALVPYRNGPSSTTLTPSLYTNATTALLPSRLFTAQTGQALATELLYRLLFDMLNRLLHTLHRSLAHQLDSFAGFLERRYAQAQTTCSETLDAVKAARKKDANGKGGLRISKEVERVAAERGFFGGPGGAGFTPCSSTGRGEWRRPNGWVGEVLDGIQEGRMVEKDFWVHPFVN